MRIDNSLQALFLAACCFLLPMQLPAAIFHVGPSQPFQYPAQVAGLTGDGDTVDIDAGVYSGSQACAAWTSHNLLIRGSGGMAYMEAAGASVWGKGIWVAAGNGIRIRYIGFSGASVPDHNGAGIRLDGSGLQLSHCYFFGNENGILGGSSGDILIEHCEFSHNGYGDGYSHNIYINHAASLTVQFCYLHHAHAGHELKSRASRNFILYNRISNESDGDASREIDLPNGGLALVAGNIIHQGPMAQNGNMLAFGAEGLSNDPPHDLILVNNTFIDERGYGGLFIDLPLSGAGLLKAFNNVFTSSTAAWISGNPAVTDTAANRILLWKTALSFTDTLNYDYHIFPSSPLMNAGTDPGCLDSLSLMPSFEYVHPAGSAQREINGDPDIGAYEASGLPGIPYQPDQSEKPSLLNRGKGRYEIIPRERTGPFSGILSDLSGKLILRFKGDGRSPVLFSLSSLPPGVYLLGLITRKHHYPFRIISEGLDFP